MPIERHNSLYSFFVQALSLSIDITSAHTTMMWLGVLVGRIAPPPGGDGGGAAAPPPGGGDYSLGARFARPSGCFAPRRTIVSVICES